MSFLYPTFLYASAAIAIPIIIHFFNLKSYKTVYFSNISFLKKVKERSKSRARLKHLLVLLLRVLAILALVFMFAQPQLGKLSQGQAVSGNKIAVYIDNSFSMEALGEKGMLLEVAKNKLRSIVQTHPFDAVFSLQTNDFDIRHRDFVSGKQLLKQAGKVHTSPVFRSLNEVLVETKKRFSAGEKRVIYVLSDFQRVSTDWDALEADSMLDLRLVPLAAQELGNVVLDSVWFEKPAHIINADEKLFVRLVNRSKQRFDKLPVSLKINGAVRTVANVDLAEEATTTVQLNFTNRSAGMQNGAVSIEDYPITFDNTYYFSFAVVDKVSVLVVNEKEDDNHFAALGRSVDLLRISQERVTGMNISKLRTYDVIVLNAVSALSSGLSDIIERYVAEGGTLLFVPEMLSDGLAQQNFLKNFAGVQVLGKDTTQTDFHPKCLEIPFLTQAITSKQGQVELPFVRTKLLFDPRALALYENLLWDRQNNPLLMKRSLGQGELYVQAFAFAADESNYMYHPLFAAVMLRLPQESIKKEAEAYRIGKDAAISLKATVSNPDALLKVKASDTNFSFIPTWFVNPSSQKLNLRQMDRIEKAGHYMLMSGTSPLASLAYNFGREESDWAIWTNDELQEIIENKPMGSISLFKDGADGLLTDDIKSLENGLGIWRYFLVLALLCLLGEVLIIRFFP